MIYKIQAQQLISNPKEVAQRQLKAHQQNGVKSKLSIYEVATLMDQLFFSPQPQQNNQTFEICFN